jgi:hypothetical protein
VQSLGAISFDLVKFLLFIGDVPFSVQQLWVSVRALECRCSSCAEAGEHYQRQCSTMRALTSSALPWPGARQVPSSVLLLRLPMRQSTSLSAVRVASLGFVFPCWISSACVCLEQQV